MPGEMCWIVMYNTISVSLRIGHTLVRVEVKKTSQKYIKSTTMLIYNGQANYSSLKKKKKKIRPVPVQDNLPDSALPIT